MNQVELRAAAARLLYNDNRDNADYNMLIEFIDNTFREKEERPLTIDELKEMNGQPVWLWNKSQKPTCVICIFDQFRTEPVFLNYDFVKEDSTNITKYDRIRKWGYKFYRHKPKEA